MSASSDSSTSGVWTEFVTVPDTPKGFTVRTAFPTNAKGAEMMLEQWEPGSEEPPHSHPGDDMTVVVEGKMTVQFFKEENGKLVPDGERIVLKRGDVGYVKGGRIHDAKYVERCKLVYVHDKAFGFRAHG